MTNGDTAYVTDRHVLLSILGDHPRTKLLAVFIGHSEKSFTAAEAADYAGLSRGTVYKHIPDLTEQGLVERAGKQGNSKLYRLNTDSEAARALAEFEWRLVEELAEIEPKTSDDMLLTSQQFDVAEGLSMANTAPDEVDAACPEDIAVPDDDVL